MARLLVNGKLAPSLLRALMVFVLVIVLVLISIVTSHIYLDDIHQQKISASRDMRSWQSKINSSVKSHQIIENFEKNFVALVEQGVVGDEDRLSWLETVQATASERGMTSVKHSVSSQQSLDYDNIKKEFPGIFVYKSTMDLNVVMGHEGDLFALLNDLEKAQGLFAVDKCDIIKAERTYDDGLNNMTAFCQLGWYTMRGEKSHQEVSRAR